MHVYLCNSMLEEIWSVTIHCVAQVAKARIGQVSVVSVSYCAQCCLVLQKNAKHLLDAVGVSNIIPALHILYTRVLSKICSLFSRSCGHFFMLVEMDYH